MSTKIDSTTNNPPIRCYVVSYVTATSGDELDAIELEHQFNQDILVVEAAGPTQAVFKAHELLTARCEFEFVITKVQDRAALEYLLHRVLARVERGEIPPATLADEDHLVWADRYLYGN